ncbi:MAG: hypothetical protein OHK0017_10620 [Patescibacteria group bacterium]
MPIMSLLKIFTQTVRIKIWALALLLSFGVGLIGVASYTYRNKLSTFLNKNSTPATNETSKSKPKLLSKVYLKAPLMFQSYSLSCEAASLRMALDYKGVYLTEDQILKEIGQAEPYQKVISGKNIVWGDPDLGFVGNVKGQVEVDQDFTKGDGWGVNNGPVAKIADKYRKGSVAIDQASLIQVEEALSNDNPVIFWHKRDDASKGKLEYKTPDGKNITQIQNHVALLVGYETYSDGTKMYIVHDPIYNILRLNQKDFERFWSGYNNEIVIVV